MDNQNQPPNSPRNRWAIIAVLLLLALGFGWWVWRNQVAAPPPADLAPVVEEPLSSPVVDEIDTSDWQTYRNEEYGFELRYPVSHTIKQENNGKNTIVFSSDELTFGVFVMSDQSFKMNQHNLTFSGNGELFDQISSTFRFIE